MEEVAILAGRGDAQDILQRLHILIAGWEGFDLTRLEKARILGCAAHHLDRRIRQIDEAWNDFTILTGGIQ